MQLFSGDTASFWVVQKLSSPGRRPRPVRGPFRSPARRRRPLFSVLPQHGLTSDCDDAEFTSSVGIETKVDRILAGYPFDPDVIVIGLIDLASGHKEFVHLLVVLPIELARLPLESVFGS